MSSAVARVCPKCGAAARAAWKFCGKCRAQLPPTAESSGHTTQAHTSNSPVGIKTPRSCPACHQPVEEGGGFCENCGARIISDTAGQNAAPPPPPVNISPSTIQPGNEPSPSAGADNKDRTPPRAVLPRQPEPADEKHAEPDEVRSAGRGETGSPAAVPLGARAFEGHANVNKLDDLYKDLAPTMGARDEPRSRKWLVVSGVTLLLLVTIVGFGAFYRGATSFAVKTDSTKTGASASTAASIPEGMVLVAGGSFRMGRDDGDVYERPEHLVTVKPFYLDTYEVTCEQYAKYVKATGAPPPPTWPDGTFAASGARLPVTGVSWIEANAYARWAGKRLPTEEEWELAARGTDARRYPWGDEWRPDAANAGDRSAGRIVEVGSYPAGRSPSGAFDMIGNAWEWTASDFKPYPGADVKPNATSKEEKVIRGGYWGSRPGFATVTYRTGWGARGEQDYSNTSFRCALDAASDAP